ncbi:NAD-glutamate dehydrogenase domain-containing protein [Nocardia sp. NPDC046763]|uniref:NAD-glutamate dehydrogenase n=1 Tax=Nocardia sp. NPDC046763 TaxID=3155256 RepID=UPI0033DF838D
MTQDWDDDLYARMADHTLAKAYSRSLPEWYKHDFDPGRAAADIARVEKLHPDSCDVALHPPTGRARGRLRLTLYIAGAAVSLSRILPVIQSLGVEVLDERTYPVDDSAGNQCWIYDFGLAFDSEPAPDDDTHTRFTEAFAAAWRGDAESDTFNRLVLGAGLAWRPVSVLRAYAKYLRQSGFPYSPERIAEVLAAHPESARLLTDLFHARFAPNGHAASAEAEVTDRLNDAIGRVVGLEADRILRALTTLVRNTLRTNYFVHDGNATALSVKLDPQRIDELPHPRPRFEIFVYSPRVEGVHLRFGAVARGGLRWSDRKEDLRTEVLGLVKAQAVKNAVIVPVGAKGGFVVKQPPRPTGDDAADRAAHLAEGIACYRQFIAGLLDVTDNIDAATGAVLPARDVVRHDGDDTYLVVAADKGTATFSDIANEVAAGYGFWLGDAFASGGSVGYDHKAMGITARGAWESVERHFHEMGRDTSTADFTVAGIGDMSGDVFGNGMLLSEHIGLVAAFDHRHIFLDPQPRAAASYAERQRLFQLPRSSWADYDPTLISAGGGVWPRSAKSVPLSPEARAALGLPDSVTAAAPNEVIRAILRAPVDLLWNGGVGTYVKAATESHADVGDKANDGVRVNAADVRATVVGEGGNLGFTARGRIEYACGGGRINTDALDNSAGVDCSDHEVNIKILLDGMMSAGRVDRAERDRLLADMTGEVGRIVLRDNHSQNRVLGVSRADAAARIGVHARMIAQLEARRGLVRALEALPDENELTRRSDSGRGLTSPELATLLAHAKLAIKDELLAGELPDDPALHDHLLDYFPASLRERFGDSVSEHPLHREIVATQLANDVIDHGGISVVFRLAEDSAAGGPDVVRAYLVATRVFGLHHLWDDIAASGLPAAVTNGLVRTTQRVLDRAVRWLLANRPQPLDIATETGRFAPRLAAHAHLVPEWLRDRELADLHGRIADSIDAGVPRELAVRVHLLLDQFGLLDIIEVADAGGHEVADVAGLYYALSQHLGTVRLLQSVSRLSTEDRWGSMARLALRDDLYGSLRLLCLALLADRPDPAEPPADTIARWATRNATRIHRTSSTLTEILDSPAADVAAMSVAVRQIRGLVRTG